MGKKNKKSKKRPTLLSEMPLYRWKVNDSEWVESKHHAVALKWPDGRAVWYQKERALELLSK